MVVEDGWVRADDQYSSGWHITDDLGSGVSVQVLGDGAVAVARVPDGIDPHQARLGVPGDEGVGWLRPESSAVLDISGPESVAVLGLPEFDLGWVVDGVQRDDFVIGLEGEDSGVEGVPSPLASSGRISFWAENGQVTVTVDGRPVAPSPQVGPAGETMFDAGPAGTAFVVPRDGRAVETLPIVRDQGRVQVADAQLRLQGSVRSGSQSYLTGVLDPGVELVAVAAADDLGQDWRLGDDSAPEHVSTAEAGRFWLFPERGLWLQQTDGESGVLRGGEVGAGVEAYQLADDGHLLFAVVTSGSEPALAVADGTVLDGTATEVTAGGLTVWSQALVLAEDQDIQRAVRGLDLDGDGALDAPLVSQHGSGGQVGEVVTLLGEPFEVTGGGWSWPTLTHVDDSSVAIPPADARGDLLSTELTGVRWSWEEPGTVFVLRGFEPKDEEWLTFRLADGTRLEPRDRYTVPSWRGPTTVLTLPPGVPADGVEVVEIGEDGSERPVP